MMLWYYLVETVADQPRFVRRYDGEPMRFRDPMTAEVLADGLRHGGRFVWVAEIDPAIETPRA